MMSDLKTQEEDQRLEELFLSSEQCLDDVGFSIKVIRRIRQRIFIRNTLLAFALAAGIAFSLIPISQLIAFLSVELVTVAVNWREMIWSEEYRYMIITGVLALLLPGVLLTLEK